jgi:uncharacterized linocin/CFP29 family protein
MEAYSQDPWTEAQWTQVQETVRNEAKKQRVAASFLPLHGPLAEDLQTTPLQVFTPIASPAPPGTLLEIIDHTTRRLTTLSVNVGLRSAQVAEPDLSTALVAFRRAANLIARTEDYLIFQGQAGANMATPQGLEPCNITGGEAFVGLLDTARNAGQTVQVLPLNGNGLVAAVTRAMTRLEQEGHLGPFAVVLGGDLFGRAHTPNLSLVLPSDRIKPLIDGPLLRSTTLNLLNVAGNEDPSGLVVSLGDDLVDLVVGSEICVRYLQVTPDASPRHVYRVSQRFTLRIKQPAAVVALVR